MELILNETRARRVALVASLALAGLVMAMAGRLWLADRWVDSRSIPSIERGIHLEPGNADAWDRLGRAQQWDLENPDTTAAILDFQKAVRYEPESPYYWIDLGGAYEQSGDIAKARAAFEHARAVYPISAQVAWFYGNFLLRQQDSVAGMEEIRRAVRSDPLILPLAISRVWHSGHDIDSVVQMLPPEPNAYFATLDFFASAHDPDPALVVWQKLLALGKPLPLARSFPFLDDLIHQDRSADARRVWLEALAAASLPHDPPADQSLIWNGSFAQPFAEGGLGWRWDSPVGTAIDFDTARVAGSGRSLRIDFGGGTNPELGSPSEYVPVEPGRVYNFRAYLHTDRISTESGMRFSIIDPNHPQAVNVVTENFTGTNPWKEIDAQVPAGPETHFLLVRLYRYPSRLFDNKLSGTVWMADLSLVRSSAPAEARKP